MATDSEISLLASAADELQDRSSCDRNPREFVGSTTLSARVRALETLSRMQAGDLPSGSSAINKRSRDVSPIGSLGG